MSSPIPPPGRNSPPNPRSNAPDNPNNLTSRVNAVAQNAINSGPQPAELSSAQTLSPRDQLIQEIDDWLKTNPSTNATNREKAKNEILTCYNTKSNQLSLERLNLTVAPPAKLLMLLPELRTLSLKENQLTSFDGSRLPNLTTLNLSNNRLSSFERNELPNLTYLHLSNNRLSSFERNKLPKLTCLYLSNNQLSSFERNELPNLETLTLSRNKFSSFDPTGLTNLTDLDLSNNQLTLFDGIRLTKLADLNLSNNQLTFFTLANALFLTHLEIKDNPALDSMPMALGYCPELTFINTENTLIPDSTRQAILASSQALRASQSVRKLNSKIQLWTRYSGLDIDLKFIDQLPDDDKEVLYEWLTRLEKSRDFQSNQRKLAEVVCNILKDLKNEEFKSLAMVQMKANNECCQDSAAMALNELYLSWRLLCGSKALNENQQLDLIQRAGRTIALRNAIGKQLEGREGLNESVETYLCYEIELAKKLNLLTCLDKMSYPRSSQNLDLNLLESEVEKNYLQEAAKLPVLDTLLKSDQDFQNKQDEIQDKAIVNLTALGEKPTKRSDEDDAAFKDRELKWQVAQGEVMRSREEAIFQVRLQFLKSKLRIA